MPRNFTRCGLADGLFEHPARHYPIPQMCGLLQVHRATIVFPQPASLSSLADRVLLLKKAELAAILFVLACCNPVH